MVEYYQGSSAAKIKVDYTHDNGPAPEVCAVDKWSVQYFSGMALAGVPIDEDCISVIDQGHARDVPLNDKVPASRYSARFTKTINDGAGEYRFSALHDDGMRLYVDGTLVIDKWASSNGRTEATGTV